MQAKVSIIILTYNNLNLTKQCLKSIRKYTPKDSYELIIIDNNSTDHTKEYLQKQKDIKVIFNKENLGFPKGCNIGINIAQKDNDILLLNNDTIVTSNWLENLSKALHSNPLIGAVGPVCNNFENAQGLNLTYTNFNEMQKKAQENNHSNKNKWELKAFLIGYCLLIKRKVINQIQFLDENYTPGYIEDNDLSLTIIKAGYKLLLCHDVYIYHYLGTSFRKDLSKFYPILNKNRAYFQKKWGFNTFLFDEKKQYSYPLIDNPKKILDYNSHIGVNALALKYKFPKAVIEGVEKNKSQRLICSKFIKTYSSLKKIVNKKYDYILIGNYLEKCDNTEFFLKEISEYLNDGGFIIGEVTNASSIKNIMPLLESTANNLNLNKNNYTIHDIKNLLKDFQTLNFYFWYTSLNEKELELASILSKYNNYLKYIYFTFKAQK